MADSGAVMISLDEAMAIAEPVLHAKLRTERGRVETLAGLLISEGHTAIESECRGCRALYDTATWTKVGPAHGMMIDPLPGEILDVRAAHPRSTDADLG